MIKLPPVAEYKPYFQGYIDLVPPGEFMDLLSINTGDTYSFFKDISLEKHNYRYAEGKWTIKEVLMHCIDTERVFAYRALVCARGDSKTIMQGMDEDLYAANADVTYRAMGDLVDEFLVVRNNSELLFQYMTEAQSSFVGKNGDDPITARSLGYIMIGHIIHHINVTKERYLK